MDTPFFKNSAMFILLAARRWAKDNPQPDGKVLYMAAVLDQRLKPICRPWPMFWHDLCDYRAFLYAKEEYPRMTHLIAIDLTPGRHPRACVREVQ